MDYPNYGLVNKDVKDFFKKQRSFSVNGIVFYNKVDYKRYLQELDNEKIEKAIVDNTVEVR